MSILINVSSLLSGFPDSPVGLKKKKKSTYNAGDPSWILGLGRYAGEGKGYTLQCIGLEISTDCIVHGVTKSWTLLSNFHFQPIGILGSYSFPKMFPSFYALGPPKMTLFLPNIELNSWSCHKLIWLERCHLYLHKPI